MNSSMNKPKLLMLSHCLPEPCGPGPGARAWQLLKIASQSSHVDLACVTDAPVNLAQWRDAAAHTRRMSMDRSSLTSRWMNRAGFHTDFHTDMRTGSHTGWVQTLNRQIRPWLQSEGYDALWCTHPALWDAAMQVPASQRICDMDDATLEQTQQAARQCTWMTSSDASGGLSSWLHHKTLWLPRAVDLSCFSLGQVMDHQPRLVLHANGHQRTGRAMWEWFGRHVWRKVKQAVPEARWDRPARQGPMASESWQNAWVIVSPQEDPDQGQWSALQAMAMCRPVVASGKAVSHMGVRHGEHLLISQKPSDWVEHCVESLRSAQVRLKLASAGRAFVERCSATQAINQAIHTKLAPTAAQQAPTSLALAA